MHARSASCRKQIVAAVLCVVCSMGSVCACACGVLSICSRLRHLLLCQLHCLLYNMSRLLILRAPLQLARGLLLMLHSIPIRL